MTDDTTTRPTYIDADGNVAPLTDSMYAAWQAEPVPSATIDAISISRAQFFQQLSTTPDPSKNDGSTLITGDEAVAAMSGSIPAILTSLISNLPTSEQLTAKMKVAGATSFEIDNPITLAIAQAYGWSSSTLQAFWNAASVL